MIGLTWSCMECAVVRRDSGTPLSSSAEGATVRSVNSMSPPSGSSLATLVKPTPVVAVVLVVTSSLKLSKNSSILLAALKASLPVSMDRVHCRPIVVRICCSKEMVEKTRGRDRYPPVAQYTTNVAKLATDGVKKYRPRLMDRRIWD